MLNVAIVSVFFTTLMGPPQSPGMYEAAFETPLSGRIRYTLSIPEGYEPGQPRPLVLALHYGGRVTPYRSKGLLTQLVEPGLSSLGAIIVAPECPTGSWNEPGAERAVMELVELIMEKYAIDTKRVLITGYSLGGHGTWYMAARHPDLFTAAIPMAGSPGEDEVGSIGKIPICIIHSVDDRVVSIGPAREALKKLKDRGVPAEMVVARGVGHYQFSGFIPYLRRAANWIKKQWGE